MSQKDPIAEVKKEAVSSPPAPASCPPPVSSRPGDRVSGASPETLGPTNSAASADGRTFSQLLAGAMAAAAGSPRGAPILSMPVETAHLPVVALPCFLAPATLLESERFTGQFATLATVTAQAVLATVTAQAQIHLQPVYPSSETLTTPQPLQQRPPQTPERNAFTPEAVHSPSWDEKSQNAQIIVKTRSSSDGYNWRKYGQKQVKSSDRSRSYYRCTSVDCSAKKKVERCPNGRETEIVYRGQHNHEPPQMTRCSKERGTQSGGPSVEKENLNLLSGEFNESDPSTSKAEHTSGTGAPDRIYCSSDCEGGVATKVEEEPVEEPEPEPEPKRRLVESTPPYSSPVLKTIKEPKIVVQSASDVARASDGYRWRKYGQKFVKGNPNPRSYYRCTHSGCPVRKHVEKASDDTKSIVITYDGKHNHDLPAFKNDSNKPAKALLIAAASKANKDEELHSPNYSDIKPPKDEELAGDKAFELGGDKALESAHTLLSIGFNSSAEEEASATNSDGINCRPLLSKNCAAVPVQNS